MVLDIAIAAVAHHVGAAIIAHHAAAAATPHVVTAAQAKLIAIITGGVAATAVLGEIAFLLATTVEMGCMTAESAEATYKQLLTASPERQKKAKDDLTAKMDAWVEEYGEG